jgi:two-component system, LytTR family, response regulator
MLKYYILDDEQNAVDALTAMLKKKFAQELVFAGSHTKASIALDEIETCQPDLLFLDIEMPEMNGLELLRHFPERKFHVIFTTAHEKYALPAIKAAAADYLLKPLSPQDVYDALKRCTDKIKIAERPKSTAKHKISLSTTHEFLLINSEDIIRVEANDNYSHFYFTNRPKVIVCKTLKEFEEQLISHNFFRVHQSHLINLLYVEAVKSNDGDYVLLQHGHKVEISRRKKAEFLQRLKLR